MAVVAYTIPLQAKPQTLQISLGLTQYTFTIYWCDPIQCWMLDISISATSAYLIRGIPLVTGTDLLGQYKYLGIPGSLEVQTDTDTLARPTYTNLGVTAQLYFVPEGQS